jgi:exopolysaccharide production protein ExoZ
VLLGLVTVGQFSPDAGAFQYFYTSPSLIGFGAGACLAQAWRHGLLTRLARLPVQAPLLVTALFIAAFFLVPATEVAERAPIYFHLIMSGAAVGIVGSALLLEQSRRLRAMAPLHYLGDASYSVYLFHLFAVAAGWAIARRLLPLDHMAVYLAVSAVIGLVALASGLVAHHLFERPLLDFFKRRRAPKRAPAMASVPA